MAYLDGSTFTDYSGAFTPVSTLAPVRAAEANQNFYVTTADGIKKLDEVQAQFRESGAPKALTMEGTLNGTSGYLPDGERVAYRVVWGYEDANANLIIGAPSERLIVTNASGNPADVDLDIQLPDGVDTSYFFQVYRSDTATSPTDPGEELGLVYEAFPTSSEVSAGTLTFTDITPVGLTGATIYTAPSQEGILAANEVPPRAIDITNHKGFMFYGNTVSKHRVTFTILAADGGGAPGTALQVDDVITIGGVRYTGKAATNSAMGEFGVSTAPTPSVRIDETARELVKVVNSYASNTTVYAYYLSGADDLPGQILIEERGFGGGEFAITYTPQAVGANPFAPQLGVNQSFPDTDVDTGTDTITLASHGFSNNDKVWFSYSGTPISGLPANTPFYVTNATVNTFQLSATLGGAVVDITSAGSGTHEVAPANVESTNDTFLNGLYFSKQQQPESVPLTNLIRVGSAQKAILRIKELRDSLFIFKEDGVFRLTGEDATSFRVDLFDNTVTLLSPESLVAVNNQIMCFADQGVVAVTETGISVISRPIEVTLLDLLGANREGVRTLSFGVSYETDRKYLFFTISSAGDTTATQAFVYNTFTQTWTRWKLGAKAGLVSSVDDRVILADNTSEYLIKERKSLTSRDFVDYGFTRTVTAVDGKTLTLDTVGSIEEGDVISQSGTVFGVITEVDADNSQVTIVSEANFTIGPCDISKAYNCRLQWVPLTGGNAGISKHFREASMIFKREVNVGATMSFASDLSSSFDEVEVSSPTLSIAWGLFPWGNQPWGGQSLRRNLRTYVTLEKQRCSQLRVRFDHRVGYSPFKLAGLSVIFEPMSERIVR